MSSNDVIDVQFGGRIPASLDEEFTAAANAIGILKKRAIAIACHAFTQATVEQRLKWLIECQRKYYPSSAPNDK